MILQVFLQMSIEICRPLTGIPAEAKVTRTPPLRGENPAHVRKRLLGTSYRRNPRISRID
jgi:hypothetical protein